MSGPHFSRRQILTVGAAACLSSWAPRSFAFGEEGAFHARLLQTGESPPSERSRSAAGRWAFELVARTSAPGRLSAEAIQVESAAVLREPFLVWAGQGEVQPLSERAVKRLREYILLGGVLVVDDAQPEAGVFRQAVQREMRRVLPDASPVTLSRTHVLFKSYYLLSRPFGRVEGPPTIDVIQRGKNVQVLFLEQDLLGALARQGENWQHEVTPGGSQQREMALRFAVNIAMYVLCSDYKDDQVHAPFLMRRRLRR